MQNRNIDVYLTFTAIGLSVAGCFHINSNMFSGMSVIRLLMRNRVVTPSQTQGVLKCLLWE